MKLADKAVTAAKIAENAVTDVKVANAPKRIVRRRLPRPLDPETIFKEGWHAANNASPWGSSSADYFCQRAWDNSEAKKGIK